MNTDKRYELTENDIRRLQEAAYRALLANRQ